MNCPRCSVNEINPVTGRCDLCGFSVIAGVATESADVLGELAARQLAHEFDLRDLLGRGRDSAVYRARERSSGRDLLVKVILRRAAEPDAAETFRELMATFAGFDHPHLVPVLRHGSTDSLLWFVTEDRGAVPLVALRREGPMDLRRVRRFATQLVAALDYLHRRGIVHGAVRAENVLVDREGWLRLADANYVRPRWRRAPRPSSAVASPVASEPSERRAPWVSPEEHERGERLPAADQYALAVLLASLVTGREPEPDTDPLGAFDADVPAHLRRALARALDPVPTRRFASVNDFLFALEDATGAAQAAPMTARRVTADVVTVRDWQPPPDGRRPRRIAVGVGIALLVVATGLFVAPAVRETISPTPSESADLFDDPVAPAPSTAATPVVRPAAPGGTVPESVRAPARRAAADPATPSRAASPEPAASATASAPPPDATPTVRLFVNASPWGEVHLDGTLLGNTPRANIPVTAGAHVLRVTRDGFTAWERRFRANPGDTLRFTDIVLEPVKP